MHKSTKKIVEIVNLAEDAGAHMSVHLKQKCTGEKGKKIFSLGAKLASIQKRNK